MIRVTGLVKRYGSFTAVDGVDIDVEPGEIHGFLGPNGAGKTTTIRIIAGLLRPTAGHVMIAGHDLEREPEVVCRGHDLDGVRGGGKDVELHRLVLLSLVRRSTPGIFDAQAS